MHTGRQTILGANGTIGSLLAKELSAYTQQIRLVSRNPKQVNGEDELFAADLTLVSNIETAVAGSEVVYLMVGLEYNFKVWQQHWPKIMRATLDACIRHQAKLVFFDNVYLYAREAMSHMTEDSPCHPSSKKGAVRKAVADMLVEAMQSGKLKAMIARSADFYGPHNEKSLLTEMVYNNLKKGKAAYWPINSDLKHSFTYTPDAAKATALLGNTEDAYGQVWHLPTDPETLTGKQLTAFFAAAMKVKPKISNLSMWMIKALGLFIPIMREFPEMMYQYDREYFFDSTKFMKRFNFKPTSYPQGIKATVMAEG